MTTTTLIERRVFAAEHQAKLALRAGRRGDDDGFAECQNRMFDTLEGAEYPYLVTAGLIRTVGRARALVLKLDRTLINLALDDAKFQRAFERGERLQGALLQIAA